MHTWDPDAFRAALKSLQVRADLTDAGIADLIGRSRSQINRWSRAENQPTYANLQALVRALRDKGYPREVVDLGNELLRAAGYGPLETAPDSGSEDDDDQTVRFALIVNPEEPEPDFPPGGLRNQSEGIIWAMVDHPWQVRWAQIKAAREVSAALEASDSRAADPSE